MDFVSAVKSDVLRPVLTHVIPGAFVVAPFLMVLGYHIPAIPAFWNAHGTAFGVIVSLAVVFVGGLLENLGSRLEVFWDRRLSRRRDANPANWEQYLRLRVGNEIIGQRYLRNLLIRMKFELSMVFALPISVGALSWTNVVYRVWNWWEFAGLVLLFLILAAYLAWESYQSAGLLERTRQLVIDAAREMPAPVPKREQPVVDGGV